MRQMATSFRETPRKVRSWLRTSLAIISESHSLRQQVTRIPLTARLQCSKFRASLRSDVLMRGHSLLIVAGRSVSVEQSQEKF
ncbi:MAG: hypothetical protein [Microviridae sp.]|nr:MAG: hypothetical protein [Microviridae sp.]